MCWRDVGLFLPEQPVQTVVYLPGSREQAERVFAMLSRPVVLVSLPVDWNRDLAPWPAQRAFKAGEDFSGGAEGFLTHLMEEVIPNVEGRLPFPVDKRCIAGYSLAGLFALWAVTRTGAFHGAASMSGSTWYDGFLDYAADQRFRTERLYLSVGDREKKTRNARMASVEDCTRALADQAVRQGLQCAFRLESGGHFDDCEARIARGINWLTT